MEDCQREVALITELAPETTRTDRLPRDASESAEAVVEDARAGREEAEQAGLAGWPEDVLLYRCFASRGVQLTSEQASTLADWEARKEPDE